MSTETQAAVAPRPLVCLGLRECLEQEALCFDEGLWEHPHFVLCKLRDRSRRVHPIPNHGSRATLRRVPHCIRRTSVAFQDAHKQQVCRIRCSSGTKAAYGVWLGARNDGRSKLMYIC